MELCTRHLPHVVGIEINIALMMIGCFAGKSESVTDEKDSDDDAAAKRNSRLLDDKIPEGCAVTSA